MRGRVVPLSIPRRLIGDMMHFAAGVPSIPVQRRMNLAALVAARRAVLDRPPWTAIFTKAFGLVAAEMPELRRAYCKFPWPRLYEYPGSVAAVAVERDFEGEKAVFMLRMKNPAERPLTELAAQLRDAMTAPLQDVKEFRRAIALARLPRPIRRTLGWLGLNLGSKRANFFGTFGVSTYSALGAESLHPLSPLTTTLNYGVIDADGNVDVRLVYDHRVLDGANIARALARMEEVLNTMLRDELLTLPPETLPECFRGRLARELPVNVAIQ
jgi:hypothetical protein